MKLFSRQTSKAKTINTIISVPENTNAGTFKHKFLKIFNSTSRLLSLRTIFCCYLAALGGSSAMAAESSSLEKEFINPAGSSFTNVVTVSNGGVKTLYISGQVGFSGNQLPDDFSQQVENAFSNLRQQLEDAGAELSDIVKTNVYIVDLDREKVAAYSAVRATHFPQQDQSASTMVGVTALAFPGLAVEIEAVAVVED
jgi:enamine deaminase RidA (YjgF/YER057c/UK114 family)|tara:strand:- start:69355 stop:69948 length:594 start_codon:yes stop_codon:yes gene_type:complete